MFGWFSKKKEESLVKEETKKGFDLVKKDISSITGWIKHLDSEKELQKKELRELKEDLSSIRIEIEGIKNALSIVGNSPVRGVFKTPSNSRFKQTAVYDVQTSVQTSVQTPNLNQFSTTEKAIIWVILNTDMKLSYDDLAAMMGKERSTLRGQINTIRQKSPGLIEEVIEKNGKKRVYIPEEIKEKLLKRAKIKENETKRGKK